MSDEPRIPYPGLRAFRRDESDLFFGRDGCVDDMVDGLAETRFLAVLGASGSGKSSLVRTGLLGALELGLHAQAGADWLVAEMHPGADPMLALAGALLQAKGAPFEALDEQLLAEDLRRGPRSVVLWCEAGHLPEDHNLLILADQFEELFRFSNYAQREAAEAFVELLLESARAAEASISVVLTMRSEFLAACTLFDGLAEQINRGLYLTPRMTRDDCAEAIEGPARVCDFTVTPALVNRLLNDMTAFAPWEDKESADQIERLSRRADQLPLMQHVLNLLWLRARERPGPIELTEADYETIGGLKGALDEHGAAVMESLGADLAPTIKAVFRALVVGNTVATAVRRPTTADEIVALSRSDFATVQRILDAFRGPGCNFLQPPLTVPLTGNTIVDLSHESLIRQWSALSEWTLEESRSADYWTRLDAAAERFPKKEGDLLHGLDLAMFTAWWDAEQPTPAWQDRHGGDFVRAETFLAQSRAVHDAAEAARIAAEQREKRNLRRRAATFATLTVLATGSAVAAGVGWYRADRSTQIAVDAQETAENALRAEAEQHEIADQATKKAVAAAEAREEALIDSQRANAEALQSQLLAARAETLRAREAARAVQADARREISENREKVLAREIVASGGSLAMSEEGQEALAGVVAENPEIGRLVAVSSESDENIREFISSIVESASTSSESGVAGASGPVSPARLAALVEELEPPSPQALGQARAALDQAQRLYALSLSNGAADSRDPSVIGVYATRGVDLAELLLKTGQPDEARLVLAAVEPTVDALVTAGAAQPARSVALQWALVMADLESMDGDRSAEQRWNEAWEMLADAAAGAPDADAAELLNASVLQLGRGWAAKNGSPEQASATDLACELAERTEMAAPKNSLASRQRVRCLWLRADGASKGDEADAWLREAESLARSLIERRPDDQILRMTLVQTLVRRMQLLDEDNPQKLELRGQAAQEMVAALDGKSVDRDLIGAARDAYDALRADDFASREARIDFFQPIARAFAPAGVAFPRSEFAYILADVRRQIGEALIQAPAAKSEAESYFAAAVSGYRDANLLAQLARHYQDDELPSFSEVPSQVCGSQRQLIRLLGERGEIERAEALFDEMRSACEPALQVYPFDFYLRMPILQAYNDVGGALYRDNLFVEAKPYLDYASHWGDGDATRMLAAMYENGEGVPPDADEVDRLLLLASGQGLKRFTVPTDFAGTTYPLNVYVREWPEEYYRTLGLTGIRDQAQWVKQARGGGIPPDVIDSFDKLQKIAIENNVSFTELAVYALGAAQDAQTDATEQDVQAILAEILDSDFRRNPWLSSDAAGVALRGYDAVSYARGAAPVEGKANVFALWNGAIWLFASEANRDAFLSDPSRYAPQYGGFCALCLADDDGLANSLPTSFTVSGEKLYLFRSDDALDAWQADPSKVAEADMNWSMTTSYPSPDRDTKLGGLIRQFAEVPDPDRVAIEAADLPRVSAKIRYLETQGDELALAHELGNRSFSYIVLGRAEDALRDTDRALEIDPTLFWIRGNRADALLLQGHIDEAIEIFRSISSEEGLNSYTMCGDILDDMRVLTEVGLISGSLRERVEQAIACELE